MSAPGDSAACGDRQRRPPPAPPLIGLKRTQAFLQRRVFCFAANIKMEFAITRGTDGTDKAWVIRAAIGHPGGVMRLQIRGTIFANKGRG